MIGNSQAETEIPHDLKSVKNGQLPALIERAQFDAFITNDKKMEAE
jgi:hypothetical protein